MDTKIKKIISDNKADLSPMSVNTYTNCNLKVLDLLKSNTIDDLYIKYNDIIKLLKEHYEKPNTIKTKLASIIVLLRCMKNTKNKKQITNAINTYTKNIDDLNNNIKSNLGEHTKTE
jgi:ABC-type long-subunit fatty acid transport system fused permease/ATPase subunit